MMTAQEFAKRVDYESQTDAQLSIIEQQIEEECLKAIASRIVPKTITIEGLKKSDLTKKTIAFLISKGYQIAGHFIGDNPETLKLIL